VEVRLADVLQRESAVEASQAMEKEPGVAARLNVAVVAAHLSTQSATPAYEGVKV
jgi:hypothetical protein